MEYLKNEFKKRLNGDQGYKILHFISRNRVVSFFIGLFFGNNLTKLAIINNTDKYKIDRHTYTEHYQRHFKAYKRSRIRLLEIGVGGYERADRGGCSLRMWKRYFSKAQIYAIDIFNKSPQQEKRIKIFKGSQVDYAFLDDVLSSISEGLDIIIDDGSHINKHVIGSFQYLFPRLRPGGVYVIEDTQTSYRIDYGGDNTNLDNEITMMNLFKKIPDYINHKEFNINIGDDYEYLKNVESIHFYHNLIFVFKNKTIKSI